ncbi:MAG: hypothetical protein II897_06695 [Clostridia bacterium]|nr:hypothetical protein [Clostridia bacterium]
MKRFISFTLILILALAAVGCKKTPSGEASASEALNTAEPAEPTAPAETPEVTEEPFETPEATEEPAVTEEPTEAPTPRPTAMPERPAENPELPKVIAGEDVFFIVKPDGSLYGWGKNDYGQLGIGTTEDVSAPRFIANGLTPVIVGETVFALSEDNILWGWGRNDMGQLGLGDGENHSRPVELMHFVKEIIPAWDSYYVLTESGALYCWGLSGDPNTVDGELEPILVDENVEYFSPYSMIKSGGELWIKRGDWAKIADDIAAVYDNRFGEYALGTDGMLYHVSYQNGLEPICDDIRDVKVSDRSAYILKNDGTLWLWNTEGEYHDVPEAELNTLTFIMDGVVEIRCDWEMDEDWGYNYNFALKANGELWAWSMPYSNAVVGKPMENSSTKPACVAENVKYVFTNNAQTYIITEDDKVMATGLADDRDAVHGGLGDGTLETRFGFVSLGLKGVCGIYTHLGEVFGEDEDSDWVELYARTFAVDEEGSIWAWGWNGDRLLGTGSSEETVLSPELITINE